MDAGNAVATTSPVRYPFWLIDGKLREADFFLTKIRAEEDLDIARYYFSAFLSAARSVTFALQKCLTGLANFDSWYADRQQQLKKHPTASYFKNIRNEVLHEGLNPLQGWIQGTMTPRTFYLATMRPSGTWS